MSTPSKLSATVELKRWADSVDLPFHGTNGDDIDVSFDGNVWTANGIVYVVSNVTPSRNGALDFTFSAPNGDELWFRARTGKLSRIVVNIADVVMIIERKGIMKITNTV